MILSHGKLITILQYFTDSFDDYWHILYPLISKEELEQNRYSYFYDISRKATDYTGEFDDNGLYLFKGYDGKYHLHFLELSQYSLACWLAWNNTKDDIWLDKALLHCKYLLDHQEQDGAWRTEHKNPLYGDLPSPWASALTQGLAISALIRAYYFTNDDKYLISAKKACDFLEIDINNNGIKREFEIRGIEGFVYEEYPRKELNAVLNGYISAILAIKELQCIDDSYQELLNKNLDNLKTILPLYDSGYYSYYALDGNISSGFYHRLVVKQLKILCDIDADFRYIYKKFFSYQNNLFDAIKALIQKVKYKI